MIMFNDGDDRAIITLASPSPTERVVTAYFYLYITFIVGSDNSKFKPKGAISQQQVHVMLVSQDWLWPAMCLGRVLTQRQELKIKTNVIYYDKVKIQSFKDCHT